MSTSAIKSALTTPLKELQKQTVKGSPPQLLHQRLGLNPQLDLSQIEVNYRAEGNANLVLALPQFKKVLRLPKIMLLLQTTDSTTSTPHCSAANKLQQPNLSQSTSDTDTNSKGWFRTQGTVQCQVFVEYFIKFFNTSYKSDKFKISQLEQ